FISASLAGQDAPHPMPRNCGFGRGGVRFPIAQPIPPTMLAELRGSSSVGRARASQAGVGVRDTFGDAQNRMAPASGQTHDDTVGRGQCLDAVSRRRASEAALRAYLRMAADALAARAGDVS